MRHNISVDGVGLRLRPVEDADAGFIVELRSARQEFLNPGAADEAAQLSWQAKYYERPGDYIFIAERLRDSRREGLISIYDVDDAKKWAVFGRWVMRADSPFATESAYLMYVVAFEMLNLAEISAQTIPDNASAVSFHQSCGLRTGILHPDYYQINGKNYDMTKQTATADMWQNNIKNRLRRLVERQARHHHKTEKNHD